MDIQIELIVIFLIVLVFVLWAVWYRVTSKKLIKNYNPNDNRSKQPQGIGGVEGGVITKAELGFAGPPQPPERSLSVATAVIPIREEHTSPGKTSPSFRNPFKRLPKS